MDTHKTQGRVRRGVAVAASGALVAGATVAMTASTTTSANAGKVNRDYTYTCTANGTSYKVGVNTRLKLPNKAHAGQRLAKRPIRLRMTMPDGLRDAVTGDPINAESARGRSKDTALTMKVGKRKRTLDVKRLRSRKADIPTDKPWKIRARGKLQSFRIPAAAPGGSKAKLKMPKEFSVNAALFNAAGDKTRATLECAVDGKRRLDTIKVRKAPSRLRANVNPTRIVADKTRARVHVKVKTTGRTSGKVVVKDRKRTMDVAKVNKNGRAHLKLKRFAHPGKHKLTIRYSGNKSVQGSTLKKPVRVFKH